MTHIDEHTLELYVLSPEEIGGIAGRIEEHLRECAGCRGLVARMRSLYADAATSVHEVTDHTGVSQALLRHSAGVAFPTDRPGYRARYTPARMQKAGFFVRTHPVVASIGGVGTIGAMLLLLNFGVNKYFADRNPSYVHYDTTRDVVEVYNLEQEVLWSVRTRKASAYADADADHVYSTLVVDLDGDQNAEVVTSIQLWDPSLQSWSSGISAFNGDGSLRFQKKLSDVVSYRKRVYPANFDAEGLVASDISGHGALELLVSVKNYRSPCYMERLDHEGNTLGRYWHFGHLHGPFVVSRADSSHASIVVSGINDEADSVDRSFPVIVVLDPAKVCGNTESSVTRGFGYARTEAERLYIRLPSSDVSKALHAGEGAAYVFEDQNGMISVFDLVSYANGVHGSTEWVFSKDWNLLAVKPTSQFTEVRARLVDEHRVSGPLDAAYLERLKRGIRYWDGKEWTGTRTGVRHEKEFRGHGYN